MRISDWSSDVCSSDLLFYVIIISMYGGGFSTLPAYLADLFGTRYVGGIHGRLLTAWAAGGILGPVLVNYIRQYQVNHGVPPSQAYTETMYLMAALLLVGFICNFFVRPVSRSEARRVGKACVRSGRSRRV